MEKCLNSVLNVKAVVAAFNQERALVGAFSVITNLRMNIFGALPPVQVCGPGAGTLPPDARDGGGAVLGAGPAVRAAGGLQHRARAAAAARHPAAPAPGAVQRRHRGGLLQARA